MRAAFPLAAGARGGWRLFLSQRISEHLSMDAKLRGAIPVAMSGGRDHLGVALLQDDQKALRMAWDTLVPLEGCQVWTGMAYCAS